MTATGISRTTAARRMSLTIEDLLAVPAVHERAGEGREEQVREGGEEEDEAGGDRRAGRREHERGEGELVDPVAEQRDQLADPERARRSR